MAIYQTMANNKGQRDCSERWKHIHKELPKQGVLLDIGSAEGYFVKKVTDTTNMIVVSVENKETRVDYQRSWLEEKKYQGKAVMVDGKFTGEFAKDLNKTCEWFDVVLLLSVLHWMPDHKEVLSNLAQMSGKLIIELPDQTDKNATGQSIITEMGDIKTYLHNTTKRKVRHLAKVKSHTSDTRDLWIVEGPVKRKPTKSHLISKTTNNFEETWDGNVFTFTKSGKKQDWTPGLNALTLSKMHVVFPSPEYIYKLAKDQLEKDLNESHGNKPDTCIWNLIIIRDGVKWIDLHHKHPSGKLEDVIVYLKEGC